MSENGGEENVPPPPPVPDVVGGGDEEDMEDDDDDNRQVVLRLFGNFVDGFEIANAFEAEEEEQDEDDDENGPGEANGDSGSGTTAEAGAAEGSSPSEDGARGFSGGGRIFDKGLPSKHLYLGENVEEVRGHRSMPDDYEEIEIPLFPERNFALVPGQVVPLTVFDPVYVSLFNGLVKDRKDFGIRFNESTSYGTLAEIFEYCPEPAYHAGMSVKARGRHRFKVMSIRTTSNGIKYAKVRIQPEVLLPKPMHTVRFHSLNRTRLEPVESVDSDGGDEEEEEEVSSAAQPYTPAAPHMSAKDMIASDSDDGSADPPAAAAPKRRRRRRGVETERMEAACSPWPSWVLKMYDEADLARRVRESIPGTSFVAQNRNKFAQSSDNMPTDPVGLSHWVARSLPFPESDRIVLLQFNSAVQRLRYELSLTAIDKFRTLGCAVCGREVAKQGDVIAMSEDGPQGVFVNMGGYIHDILTFSKLTNKLRLRGGKEVEFSWFPGYAWRIGECTCASHLGWKFDATEKKLAPSKFYAVLKNKISWSMNTVEDLRGVVHPHS